jgi:TetR/AcrR family transcriptional repressor of lmrAB and yxaGH operons
MIGEMLADLAARHRGAKAFLRAYCRVMAGWMEESGFRSGCPIATTLLETAPASPAITGAGQRALDAWVEIVAEVLARDGLAPREARSRAQLVISAMEGALILARVRQSPQPILDVAKLA